MKIYRLAPLLGLLLLMFLVLLSRSPAQNTSAASADIAIIDPGSQGTLEVSGIKPVSVNEGGELLNQAGLGRLPADWPDDPWVMKFQVLDTLSIDSCIVRYSAKINPGAAIWAVNYKDTLVTGVSKAFPRKGGEVSGLTYGIVMVTPGDFTDLSPGDVSWIYLRDYAAYSVRTDKRRQWFYGSVSATLSDTTPAVGWSRRGAFSLTLTPGGDSCTVTIAAQVFVDSWLEPTRTLETSYNLGDSVNVFTPLSVLTGDSLRFIITPIAEGFSGTYVSLRGYLAAQ